MSIIRDFHVMRNSLLMDKSLRAKNTHIVKGFAPGEFYDLTYPVALVPKAVLSVANDAAETDAATSTSGNVLANDSVSSGSMSVIRVNRSAAKVGVPVAGSNGGLFTIGSDGAWTFDPDGDFDALTGEYTATTSATYHVSDGVSEEKGAVTVTVGAVVASGDPYWDNVALCVMAEGEDGSTTFTDYKGKTVTASADVMVKTTLGYPAFYFDGDGCHMAVGSSSADIEGLYFGADDFTIDYYLRKVGNIAASSRLWNADGDYYHDISIGIDGSGNLSCYMTSDGYSWNLLVAPAIATLANDTDYFIRFARDGGTMRCGINGTVYTLTTGLGTASLYPLLRSRTWGGQGTGTSRSLNGYIRGIRVTRGVARDAAETPEFPFPTA